MTSRADLLHRPGRYDALYAASDGFLWCDRPGRVVEAAAARLPSGRGLDLGCGDGKNLLYLEQRGWRIDGVDVSGRALEMARARMTAARHPRRGRLVRDDVVTWRGADAAAAYDLVIAYGLFHCLDDADVTKTVDLVRSRLRRGGHFAFAAFNDRLPIPDDHRTGPIFLRDEGHVLACLPDWDVESFESGEIVETHPPLVPQHRHAVTWAFLRKP